MFNEHGKLPSEWNNINRLDKAAIIAFIQEKSRKNAEREKEMKKQQNSGKKRKR